MVNLVYKLHSYDASGNPLYYAEIAGLSSASKPTTGLVAGSKFVETNTGKTFILDAESTPAAWHEMVVATAEVQSS